MRSHFKMWSSICPVNRFLLPALKSNQGHSTLSQVHYWGERMEGQPVSWPVFTPANYIPDKRTGIECRLSVRSMIWKWKLYGDSTGCVWSIAETSSKTQMQQQLGTIWLALLLTSGLLYQKCIGFTCKVCWLARRERLYVLTHQRVVHIN